MASLVLFAAGILAAEPTDVTLALMNHKAWTARDGAPHAMRSLAQDPDGTLWIGTEIGLFNFDGRAFRPFRPFPGDDDVPVGVVAALAIARDGALWAATLHGAVRISRGRLTAHFVVDGKPLSSLLGMAAAADGSVWGYGRGNLVRFGPDGTDHAEPTPIPIETNVIGGIFVDSADTLWLTQGDRLYQRKANQTSYTATEVNADFLFGVKETPDGSLWIADFDTKQGFQRYQRVSRTGKVVAHLSLDETPYDILYTPDGSLTVATQKVGLRRLHVGATANEEPDPSNAAPDRYTSVDGLAGNGPRSLLLDADGNIWVANVLGLDRFRAAELIPFIADAAARWTMCAKPDGEVWIASSSHQLYKVSHGVRSAVPNEGDVYHLACGRDGDTWMVDKSGIRVARADGLISIPPIPGAAPYGVSDLAGTSSHELYASVTLPTAARGVWRYSEGSWSRAEKKDVPGTNPQTVYVDTRGRVWAGYRDGIVALPFENEGRTLSSGSPGLDIVLSIFESPLGIFVSGTNGLAIFRDTRFEMLTFADPDLARGIGGMIDARNGDLWLNAAPGVVRVRKSELEAARADVAHPIQATLVTEGEWVGPAPLVVKDTAARDAEGNLWFATFNGVFHLDPGRIDQGARHAPIVSLRSMTVDGLRIAAGATIDPDPQMLVIQYLGVNLTSPESVAYKYRLKGLEDAWQDAGHRAEAIYTRLRPGTYSFEVIASNGGDQWSAPFALPPFTVRPNFFQTTWFTLLCALGALAIVGIVSALRIRIITRSMRARVEERADERVQIARDLHDTLLQGIQGLLLNVHVATQKISDGADAKPMLERALSTADRIIIEGRNRISALRSEHVTDAELTAAVESICSDLSAGKETRYRVVRRGSASLSLDSHVADEVFHIAREALTNASRYADAMQIGVVFDYGNHNFELSCEDDGRGFDPDAENRGHHWGLKGMAERAAKLGGRFACRSEPMRGTRISVVIPAFRAYYPSRWIYYFRGLGSR